jgi:hypothetical protein
MRASGPWPGPPADRRTGFAGAGAGKDTVIAVVRLEAVRESPWTSGVGVASG